MMTLQLKTGQVAAVVGITPKQLQNDVDAGYVRPTVASQGRGSVRLFSVDTVVHLTVLDLLVQAYGLERHRAATVLAQVWPPELTYRVQVLRIPPAQTAQGVGIALEPICLPFRAIVEATEQRIAQMLATYGEKKRGRPAGWSRQMRQALADVSVPLQEVSEVQIRDTITAYRTTRRPRTRQSTGADAIVADNLDDFPPVPGRTRPEILTPAAAVARLWRQERSRGAGKGRRRR